VRVRLPEERIAAGEAVRVRRDVEGIGGILDTLAAGGPAHDGRERARLPDPGTVHEIFRALYTLSERYQESGGVHTAALCEGERIAFLKEDVGRHNAVDKVVGLALLAEEPLARLGLVLTSRVSAEIAIKAARAGVAWIASRSVPTTLALRVAETVGVPIIARAAGKDAHLFPAAPTDAPRSG
jgi:formate dehydrogenase assembly factor FdhD